MRYIKEMDKKVLLILAILLCVGLGIIYLWDTVYINVLYYMITVGGG